MGRDALEPLDDLRPVVAANPEQAAFFFVNRHALNPSSGLIARRVQQDQGRLPLTFATGCVNVRSKKVRFGKGGLTCWPRYVR